MLHLTQMVVDILLSCRECASGVKDAEFPEVYFGLLLFAFDSSVATSAQVPAPGLQPVL